jgi:opacity protein-like surface antigen
MKKSSNLKLIIMSLLLSFTVTSQVQARPDDGALILSLFGVVNETVDKVESEDRNESIDFGFGALVEANVNGFLGIETGLLYVKRQYEYSAAGSSLVQQVNRLHVPVLAKFWPTNFLYVGAGPYVSFKTGSVNSALNIGGVDVGSVDTSADDDVELGYDISTGVNFSVADKTGVFVELRYSSPFEKESSENYEELTALAGVKIAI